jgi:hypothetical protein
MAADNSRQLVEPVCRRRNSFALGDKEASKRADDLLDAAVYAESVAFRPAAGEEGEPYCPMVGLVGHQDETAFVRNRTRSARSHSISVRKECPRFGPPGTDLQTPPHDPLLDLQDRSCERARSARKRPKETFGPRPDRLIVSANRPFEDEASQLLV